MEIFFDWINWEWNNNEKYENCLKWKICKILHGMLKTFDKFWSIYCKFYFDKSDTNRILFDQNCYRQIPGVDVYCFGVSNDICMLCASMNVPGVQGTTDQRYALLCKCIYNNLFKFKAADLLMRACNSFYLLCINNQ